MNVIEVKNLKKYYNRGKVRGVEDITFNIPQGSRFGFLGPNGAGKTTTIRCLLGLLQIDAGEITILGEKINPRVDVEIRNHIGYLPGELGLYKDLNAYQLINYFAKLYDVVIDWDFIKDVAKRLKIDMKRKISELSKGNKQKVGVLAAIMGKFDILIMDEPTSGLDPLMQSEFYRIISERQKESNCTVFISTHVLPEVEKFCDRVAIIKEGLIVEISDVQDLKEKSLKKIELDFETVSGMKTFHSYLTSTFPGVVINYSFDDHISFLLPPKEAREILKDLGERKWNGEEIKDFTIQHSSLESIFLQYYKDTNMKKGEIA
ncbi:MAG: ABC transporter ATP-binding protein [Candidatus Hermodarchaeota archaeon]